MKKTTSSVKYFIILIIFGVAFFISIGFSYSKYHDLTQHYAYQSIDGRLKWLETKTSMGTLANVAQDLTLEYNYEPEFDPYWKFAEMECYFMQGMTLKRAVKEGDLSKQAQLDTCIQFVQNYMDDPAHTDFKALAENDLNRLKE